MESAIAPGVTGADGHGTGITVENPAGGETPAPVPERSAGQVGPLVPAALEAQRQRPAAAAAEKR